MSESQPVLHKVTDPDTGAIFLIYSNESYLTPQRKAQIIKQWLDRNPRPQKGQEVSFHSP